MILNYTILLYNRIEDCLKLQDDLDSSSESCTENGLSLSVTKYSKIPFCRTENKISFDYLIVENNMPAEYHHNTQEFDVIFQSNLQFSTHID